MTTRFDRVVVMVWSALAGDLFAGPAICLVMVVLLVCVKVVPFGGLYWKVNCWAPGGNGQTRHDQREATSQIDLPRHLHHVFLL